MANLFFVKEQFDLAAATLTGIYTCPAGYTAEVAVFVCNRSASAVAFRLSVARDGAADANGQYLFYDAALAGNDTFLLEKFVLNQNDVIRAQSSAVNVSVNISINDIRKLAEF